MGEGDQFYESTNHIVYITLFLQFLFKNDSAMLISLAFQNERIRLQKQIPLTELSSPARPCGELELHALYFDLKLY